MASNERARNRRLSGKVLRELSHVAWTARENSRLVGKTKVGCAILSVDGRIFGGCNVEHRFRCHDVHAEVNAITSLVAAGGKAMIAVLIAAEREGFTPCGGCMDWIFELGGKECIVVAQARQDGPFARYTAKQLMPHYPK